MEMPDIILTTSFEELINSDIISPFAMWINLDREDEGINEHNIKIILEKGCLFFHFSGSKFDNSLDLIDFVIENFSQELILTTSSNEGLAEGAFNFCTMSSPRDKFNSLVLLGVSNNNRDSLKLVEEMNSNVRCNLF